MTLEISWIYSNTPTIAQNECLVYASGNAPLLLTWTRTEVDDCIDGIKIPLQMVEWCRTPAFILQRRGFFCSAGLRKTSRALRRCFRGLSVRRPERCSQRLSMIRSVDSVASFCNFRSVGSEMMTAGAQEGSMVRVSQFLPSVQSAGFSRSGRDPTASIIRALHGSAISSLIRLRASSENHFRK
jgi:hypothetical protein